MSFASCKGVQYTDKSNKKKEKNQKQQQQPVETKMMAFSQNADTHTTFDMVSRNRTTITATAAPGPKPQLYMRIANTSVLEVSECVSVREGECQQHVSRTCECGDLWPMSITHVQRERIA